MRRLVLGSGGDGRAAVPVFWTAACFLLLWDLGARGLWGPEGRWAEITREMLRTGDFLHPTINGNPYFDKPLLTYWLVAVASAGIGRLNEWAVRIPSALSALAGLWGTLSLGRRLWSGEVARTAGWILLTSYGVLFWGRTGTADLENLAAVVLAVAWYWGRRDRLSFLTFLVFYLICFAGAQTKGLTAVAVPVLAVLPGHVRERRWRSLFTPAHLLALAAGAACYLFPFLYADMTRGGYRQSGLFLAFRENVLRYVRPFDHVKPFYVYLYYLPAFLLPWAPLFLAAVIGTALSLKSLDRSTRWLGAAVLLTFLFFSCSGSRRGYYILPLLPFCALMTAVFFTRPGYERLKRLGLGLQAALLILLAAAEVLSPALWPRLASGLGFVPPAGLRRLTPAVGLLAAAPWVLPRRLKGVLAGVTGADRRVAAAAAATAILMGGFFCGQQGALESLRTEKPFVRRLRRAAAGPPAREVAFYRAVSPKVLFYLDPPAPVRLLGGTDEVREFCRPGPRGKILVARREYLDELRPYLPEKVFDRPLLNETVHPWQDKGGRGWKGSEKWRGNLTAWGIPAAVEHLM